MPARGTGSRPKRRRRDPGPKRVRVPHILVLGTSRAASRLSAKLEKLGVARRQTRSTGETDAAFNAATRAVVIVPPIADVSVTQYGKELREAHPSVPTFVVMRGPLPERATGALYRSGVQAVFEWPNDKEALMRTAFRLAGSLVPIRNGAAAAADVALEELVRERLRTASVPLGGAVVATVRHRYALLSGSVDALFKVHVAEQIAADVPGVDEVVSVGLEVAGPTGSDRSIGNAIRQVLKHTTQVDSTTLAVRVDDGRATLSGIAGDAHELERTLELVRHVRGVRGVDNLATTSKRAKRRGRALAQRVRAALALHFHGARIDVTVFGGIVVLRGRVESAARRRTILAFAESQDGVERVVDKLQVRAPRAPRHADRDSSK